MGIFANRDYRWWLTADTSSAIAASLRWFAVPIAAYALTQDTVLAGTLGTAQMLLFTGLSLIGGVIIDRNNRGTLIRIYGIAGLVVWGAVGLLAATGQLQFWSLTALALAGSVAAGLFGEATDSALRSIVSTQEYPTALATNQGRDAVIELTSGPIGGALYGLSPALPFAAASLGHGLAAASITGVRANLTPPAYERKSMLGDVLDTWRWIFSKKRLRWFFPVLAAVNLAFGGILFTFQFELLSRGLTALDVGLLNLAMGVSMLVGALAAGPITQRVPTGILTVVALAWVPIAFIPVLVSDSRAAMLISIAIMGIPVAAMNSSMLGYAFSQVPTELQGRVQSSLGVLSGGLMGASPLLAGSLLPAIGYTATNSLWVTILALAAAGAAVQPGIRELPKPDRWDDFPL